MLHLIDIAKAYGPRTLFEGLSWHIAPGQRVGLVGRNGVGKTTLFRLITGEESVDEGKIVRSKRVRVGHLAQETGDLGTKPVIELVLAAATEVKRLEAEIARFEAAMSDGQHDAETLLAYEEVQARFEALGGYQLDADARRILAGLGFSDEAMSRPVDTLSGGWRMRVALARLLLAKPELLLLDEPTNHLDLQTLIWFEGFIADYPGTLVVISHDRYLLNRVVNVVAELTHRGADLFFGSYDDYLVERDLRRDRQLAQKRAQDKTLAKTERFVERFRYKASKAAAVQSRVKALGKVERIAAPEADAAGISFRFATPVRSGKDVVTFDAVAKAYGPVRVYDSLNLTLYRAQRVALVGPNGAGKSTLMKLMAGIVEPDEGQVILGHQVERGYFAQHQLEALNLDNTVLAELESVADFDQLPRCRGLLGAFRFSGGDVDKKVRVLSGGEKARLALAKLLLAPANLLLLDEPTNHLDIQSRNVLEAALESYDGTIVLISHDRHFINAVCDTVVEVDRGRVEVYPGTWEDYRRKKAEQVEPGSQAVSASSAEARTKVIKSGRNNRDRKRLVAELRATHSRETRALRAECEAAEARIAAVEDEIEAIDTFLATPEAYNDPERVKTSHLQRATLETEQTDLMTRWEHTSLTLESAEAAFSDKLEELS